MIIGELDLFLSTRQYLALFLLLGIEEAGVPLPLPGDTAIMFLGYRVSLGLANPLLVILDITLATLLGSSLLYYVSRRLGRPAIVRFGRYIRLDEDRLSQIEGWFAKHGVPAIVFGRMIPGLRTLISIAAGIFEIPYRSFAPATALSAFLWAVLYMLLGVILTKGYLAVTGFLTGHTQWLVLALAIVALLLLLKRYWRRIAHIASIRCPLLPSAHCCDSPVQARPSQSASSGSDYRPGPSC